MSVSNKALPSNFADNEAYDPTLSNAVEYSMMGAAGDLVMLKCDNSANGSITYCRFYDASSGVTLGTDSCEMIIPVPASTTFEVLFVGDGPNFATALSMAAVTDPGETGTTAPGSAVPVRLLNT